MGSEPVTSVLIVDDDVTLRDRLGRAFRDRGYEVSVAGSYDEAMAMARDESPEWAVVDLRMPGPSGLELIQGLKGIDETTLIVVLTGYGSIATAVQAVRLGACNYVTKPADADEIIAAFAGCHKSPLAEEQSPEEFRPPSLARLEWEHINRVLGDCGGNVSETARRLGMHRRTLQRKLQKHPPRS